MLDDERLRACTVGDLQALAGPIAIVEYDPGWPQLYENEDARIRSVLGTRVLVIEHVGSTAVPGLAAKPVIDVLLVVEDSAREETYLTALEGAAYELRIREPNWHEHRMFKRKEPAVNLHVFSQGCPEVERMLVFRDWLRSHEADRKLYERTKQELAQRKWKYTQNYADAKTVVVEEIMARAMASRSRT